MRKPRGAVWVAFIVSISTLVACDRFPGRRGGRLEASWTGADTGRVSMAANAEWCATGGYLRIEALHGDTGLAITVFPADTALPGEYPLALAADSSRPAAAVAFRWLDAMALAGFRSDSGTATLRRGSGGDLSGEFTAAGRLSGSRPRDLRLVGQFHGLTIRPAADDCPVFLKLPASDSGRTGAGVDSSHGDDLL